MWTPERLDGGASPGCNAASWSASLNAAGMKEPRLPEVLRQRKAPGQSEMADRPGRGDALDRDVRRVGARPPEPGRRRCSPRGPCPDESVRAQSADRSRCSAIVDHERVAAPLRRTWLQNGRPADADSTSRDRSRTAPAARSRHCGIGESGLAQARVVCCDLSVRAGGRLDGVKRQAERVGDSGERGHVGVEVGDDPVRRVRRGQLLADLHRRQDR